MDKVIYILICHFGLEKVLKAEVRRLGLEIIEVTDGEVKAVGNVKDIPRLNLMLRTSERVMIEVANFEATTFEELFQGTFNSKIEKYVPVNGKFIITKANQDKNSILHSSRSTQSIVKKAMVERLKKVYNTDLLSENGETYPFRVKFNKNIVSIRLDTTGTDSLHKRGYRKEAGLAPIEETLVAALISLTDYKGGTYLIDPFCGSGTFLIEAASIGHNICLSKDRDFISKSFKNHLVGNYFNKFWDEAYNEIKEKEEERHNKIVENGNDKGIRLIGFDIDKEVIKIAKENAKRAGVQDLIHFEVGDIKDLKDNINKVIIGIEFDDKDKGIIITNPPYGERLEEKENLPKLYKMMKKSFDDITNVKKYIITGYEDAEKYLGKANKNRKIYNGMIKSYFLEY